MARREIDAMREDNQATFLVADETAKYNLKVPVEVVKLDYFEVVKNGEWKIF